MTTCGNPSISRPRAAISVATSDRRPARLEVGERANALALALLLDRDRRDAIAAELLGESVGAVLRAREDERLVDGAGADEVAEQLALALAIDRVTTVTSGVAEFWGVTWTVAGSWRKPCASERISAEKVAENRSSEVADREYVDHLTDVADEAHVEHAIGLVEDEDLDGREVDRPLADVVEQATGRGDDEVDPAAERVCLARSRRHRDRGRADAPMPPVDADALLDLERELPGRGEDEGTDRAPARA